MGWYGNLCMLLAVLMFHLHGFNPLSFRMVAFLGGLGLLAVVVGVVESTTARFRMNKVPQFLVAGVLASAFAFLLLLV